MTENATFFYHANEQLFDAWDKTDGRKPMKISDLNIDDFEDDIHQKFESENVFEVFNHYWNNSEIASIATGDTLSDCIWCMYRGYVWLFAMFQFASPDYEDDKHTILDIHVHFDTKFFQKIDKKLE